MKYRPLLLLPVALFFSLSYANDYESLSENLRVDQTVLNSQVIEFPNPNNIRPEVSDFSVLHTVTMSDETGERWATVTLTNQAKGRRIIKSEHVMALFADGTRINPISVEKVFKANETNSLTIYFGNSRFPILKVYTRS